MNSILEKFVLEKAERDFDPKITREQIMQKPLLVGCWGTEFFKGLGEKALILKVNGFLHKGYVLITLGFMDTYDIHLLDMNYEQVGKTMSDIYCDQLTDAIDGLVETK